MEQLSLKDVEKFVSTEIVTFHKNKLEILKRKKLQKLLRDKNPYLFKAKNILIASDLVTNIMDAYLYASEEKLFGDFLEELAIFVAGKTYGGRKSSATGIDLEFEKCGRHYLVSVKSGPNWGNSSQQKKQQTDFQKAVGVLKQSRSEAMVEPVLGICYGKSKTKHLRGYTKVMGQLFWNLLGGNPNLYTDIIEPLGHDAKKHNEEFLKQKAVIINTFTAEFLKEFCGSGQICWDKLVKFNSGNMTDDAS
ncbi:MAG: cytosolic protein [candidate division Zixibacteria bacterium]|nr:cytosolic protein [candidate division Zixibacteria bacterium]MBU1469391.1 cytosolic protein [candidate division Zixibacteria bacterium]MBU2624145.1 cytosolic protein [candidate division Zixibacteria bacterium]